MKRQSIQCFKRKGNREKKNKGGKFIDKKKLQESNYLTYNQFYFLNILIYTGIDIMICYGDDAWIVPLIH